jgi:hypothetical protein
MPTDEETLDQIEQSSKDAQARSDALKKRMDKLDRKVDPPPAAIDHANDGGVI